MTRHCNIAAGGSLIERAAEVYDFTAALRRAERHAPTVPVFDEAPEPVAVAPESEPAPAPVRGEGAFIDRAALAAQGFIDPDAPVGELAEEFRIVKRQLLLDIAAAQAPEDRFVLVCSANANEGKTFCAINLALSLAGEQGAEVLLVDGDFAKPEILSILGIEPAPGLIDAIADPRLDVNDFVVTTDIPGLSVLAAGRRADTVTELLAGQRAAEVLAALAAAAPRRIVIFDSPPALAASPASVLAQHAGQAVLVVHADRTTEADLRQAASLLSGCANLRLLLNGAAPALSGRKFGSYYGHGQ